MNFLKLSPCKLLLSAVMFVLIGISIPADTLAQTLMPIPNHSRVYSGSARGYWFIAPTSFTITGLRVPSQAGSGKQYIQVVKLNVTPPISAGSQTTNFTTLAYINGATNGVIQTVNIPISSGDVIGILGTAGRSNSYASGAYTTNIYGNNFTIQRFGYQGHIDGGATSQVWGVAQGASGNISRVELYYGQPCAEPTNLAVTGVSSMAADFTWSGVSGSVGYDYVVDTAASKAPAPGSTGSIINTTNTTATVGGLTPSTKYYLHVRNYCSSTSKSAWDTVSFETLPPCSPPDLFTVTRVDSNSVDFTWNPLVTGLNYLYVVDTMRSDPVASAATSTTTASGSASGLEEGTKYYVHIKAYCQANDSSGWSLDSFYTTVVCRVPLVSFRDINTNRAIAYWDHRASAVEYEYLLSTEPTTPAIGTRTPNNFIQLPNLASGKKYYLHIRTHCNDRGVNNSSPWTMYDFSTFALSVAETKNESFVAVYPNPTTGSFTFLVDKVEEDGTLIIADISGKVLQRVAIENKQTTISLNTLVNGIYMLKYITPKSTGVYRILKK